MTFAVASLGGRETLFRPVVKALTYLLASSSSGTLFGFIISSLIYWTIIGVPEVAKLIVFSGIILLYITRELSFIHVLHPQRRWQIPSSWVNHSPILNMVIWGCILGAGIFTYNPYVSFWILYVYIGFFLTPTDGIWIGMVYGFARALPSIYYALVITHIPTNNMQNVMKEIWLKERMFRLCNQVLLVTFFIYVLASSI